MYTGGVSETLAVEIPLAIFLRIVNASRFEMRLGGYELSLSPDNYQALKGLRAD